MQETAHDLKESYFRWLYSKVLHSGRYEGLMNELYMYDYIYRLPMDANRGECGTELRYRFGDEANIPQSVIASDLDIRPCSMLEMMVALALHISDVILDDGEVNRANIIFSVMLDSLGLEEYTDYEYCPEVAQIIRKRLDAFTEGTKFLFPTYGQDMRGVDIWTQMHMYLQRRYMNE